MTLLTKLKEWVEAQELGEVIALLVVLGVLWRVAGW